MIRRILLIGCGNMAGAMLGRWLELQTVAAGDVVVINRTERGLPDGVQQMRSVLADLTPDLVMLGTKPQQLSDVAAQHADGLRDVPLLVSLLAGVDIATLAARFPGPAIVRAMPNLPVATGKGVVGLHGTAVTEPVRSALDALMHPLGVVQWIDHEPLLDVVAALSGSGPAFLYRFIDALATAGTALGLTAQDAARLALATVEGAANLAARADVSPAILADRVASPGGSTRQGLNVLDEGNALTALVERTLAAAVRRNREMAAVARG